MIIVKIMGGLGNQLQQYAFYRKLESLGRDVRLDVSWFERPGEQEAVLAKRTMELNWFEGQVPSGFGSGDPRSAWQIVGRAGVCRFQDQEETSALA